MCMWIRLLAGSGGPPRSGWITSECIRSVLQAPTVFVYIRDFLIPLLYSLRIVLLPVEKLLPPRAPECISSVVEAFWQKAPVSLSLHMLATSVLGVAPRDEYFRCFLTIQIFPASHRGFMLYKEQGSPHPHERSVKKRSWHTEIPWEEGIFKWDGDWSWQRAEVTCKTCGPAGVYVGSDINLRLHHRLIGVLMWFPGNSPACKLVLQLFFAEKLCFKCLSEHLTDVAQSSGRCRHFVWQAGIND